MKKILCLLPVLLPLVCSAGTIVNNTGCTLYWNDSSATQSNLYWMTYSGSSDIWTAQGAANRGLAPLASGASGTFSQNSEGLAWYGVRVWYAPYRNGPSTQIGGTYNQDSDWPSTLVIDVAGGCGVVSNWYCAKISMKNIDSVYRAYAYLVDGTLTEWKWLSPGEPWNKEKCDSVYHVLRFQALDYSQGEPTLSGDPFGNQSNATNGTPAAPDVAGNFQAPGNQYQGGTTNIAWGTNAPNLGDSAIYDALTKFATQNHLDMNSLLSSNSTTVNLSNSVNVTVTNATDLSSLSNLLTQIRNNATNNADGNSLSNRMDYSQGTNWATGQSYTEGVIASSGLGGKIDQFNEKFGQVDLPAPVLDDWEMEFCGQVINLNPITRFGSVANACLLGMTSVAWLGFGIWASRLFFNTVRVGSNAELGGVPDLSVEAGTFGSNIIGYFVGLFVPFVFVLGWTVLLYAVLTNITDYMIAAIGWAEFQASLGAKAWYLLNAFFPVELLINLALITVTLTVTVSKIIWIACGASRFLFGK